MKIKILFVRGDLIKVGYIKPDIIADHILINWLTIKNSSGTDREPTEVIFDLQNSVISSIVDKRETEWERKILLALSRIDFLLKYDYKQQVDFYSSFFEKIIKIIPSLKAIARLILINYLEIIAPIYPEKILDVTEHLLQHTSESEQIITTFGTLDKNHDDVILAIPWLLFKTAAMIKILDIKDDKALHARFFHLLSLVTLKEHEIIDDHRV